MNHRDAACLVRHTESRTRSRIVLLAKLELFSAIFTKRSTYLSYGPQIELGAYGKYAHTLTTQIANEFMITK